MSIISDALKKKITWGTAALQIGTWFGQVGHQVMSDPQAVAAVQAVESNAKQAASDALSLADSEVGSHLGEAASAIEGAVDLFLTKATGGVGTLAVPFVNSGIDHSLSILKGLLDAKALEWKAKLAPPVPAVPVTQPAA